VFVCVHAIKHVTVVAVCVHYFINSAVDGMTG